MKHMPPRYIRKVCRKLAAKAGRKGIEGVIDSSGFRLRTSSSWYDIRRFYNNRRKWLKGHHVRSFAEAIFPSLKGVSETSCAA
jgi:hypothetical protein